MSTNESDHENRYVEETGAHEDGDTPMMTQGDSSRRDHPRRFDGFDLPTNGRHLSSYGLKYFDHARHWRPSYGAFVKVYAQLGLHCYNLLEGTNYQFSHLQSYNKRMNPGAAPYYLTLFATCPDSGEPLPFHAFVSENDIGVLDISVHVTRPQGSEVNIARPRSEEQPLLYRPSKRLPPWPSSSEMLHQRSFYMLNEHEVQNTDWVRVYLDLAHSTYDRGMTVSQLSNFYIEKVAIQSLSGDPPRLDSKSLVVYMVYKDLEKYRLRQPCYRKAIIRRLYNESLGSLTLQGKHWSFSEEEEKKENKKVKKKLALLKKRLGVSGAWRLGLDVYLKRGIRSSSRTR